MKISEIFDGGVVTLYRGDATKIEAFSATHNKNAIGILFGHGIYLTDNPAVANEYTTPSRTFLNMGDFKTSDEAMSAYVSQVMGEIGFTEAQNDLKEKYQSMFWEADKRPEEDIRREYSDELKKLRRSFISKAKKNIAEKVGSLKLVKIHGYWRLIDSNNSGIVTTFNIPSSYVSKCLHGDLPLPDKALSVLSKIIRDRFGDGVGDFRDINNQFMQFDDWVAYFKNNKVHYAWNDELVGGKGQNPSLDEIMNGTYAGGSIKHNMWDEIIDSFMAVGYVGIVFGGGVSFSGNLRGGGSSNHTSYVFWDSSYINSCIVEQKDGIHIGSDINLKIPSKKIGVNL